MIGDTALRIADQATVPLLPCPFCGGAMQLREALWVCDGDTDSVIHAEPTDCPLSDFTVYKADRCASVITAWNTRLPASRGEADNNLPALEEELRERTALRYIGDCKCGKCQLVPRDLIDKTLSSLSSQRRESEDLRGLALRLVEEIEASEEHGAGATETFCPVCQAIEAMRAALQGDGDAETKAARFEAVSYADIGSTDAFGPTIDKMYQRDGSAKWKVSRGGACLNKLGEWEYEPQPSSREDDFLERCRYSTLDEAIAALDRNEAVPVAASERAQI